MSRRVYFSFMNIGLLRILDYFTERGFWISTYNKFLDLMNPIMLSFVFS